jgi:hypothetical protein
MAARIYKLKHKKDPTRTPRLVRAKRSTQAVNHVAHSEWEATVASQNDLEQLLVNGVEDATSPAQPTAQANLPT